jgi:putative flippase GtrA
MRAPPSRYLRFNAVGVAGFVVQLAVVAALTAGAGAPAVAATAAAVEAALLHNFFWHERWTWRDRPARGGARIARLARFHLANGAVSMAGNVLIVWLLTRTGADAVWANAAAVVVCSAINFAAGERLVFRTKAPHAAAA